MISNYQLKKHAVKKTIDKVMEHDVVEVFVMAVTKDGKLLSYNTIQNLQLISLLELRKHEYINELIKKNEEDKDSF